MTIVWRSLQLQIQYVSVDQGWFYLRSLPRCRPGRDRCYRTLQSTGQDHSGGFEAGEVAGYFGGLCRAIPGTSCIDRMFMRDGTNSGLL